MTGPGRYEIAALLMGLLFALVAAEGFVRFLKRDIAFQPDPNFIRSLRPNIERKVYSYDTEQALTEGEIPSEPVYVGMDYTNNLGLRMKEDVGPKAQGEHRILLLGDSYTEAQQVGDHQRFYHLLGEALKNENASGLKWQVINGGIQNGSPSQYILQLRDRLPLIRPDLVILVFGSNDLKDDYAFERDYGYVFDEAGIPISLKSRFPLWLMQKSWLVRYLYVFISRPFPNLSSALFRIGSPSTPVPSWAGLYCRVDEQGRGAFEQKTGRYLVKIKEMVEANDATFGVFLIHYMWMFNGEPYYPSRMPAHFKKFLEEWNCSDPDVPRQYNEYIETFLRDHGIDYWNSYDAFLDSKSKFPNRKLWGYYDYHFSPAGHKIVADELRAFVGALARSQSPEPASEFGSGTSP